MQLIKCTKKLLDEFPQKTPSEVPQENNLGSWHANIFNIEKRKCVLVTNDLTLYAMFIHCLGHKIQGHHTNSSETIGTMSLYLATLCLCCGVVFVVSLNISCTECKI